MLHVDNARSDVLHLLDQRLRDRVKALRVSSQFTPSPALADTAVKSCEASSVDDCTTFLAALLSFRNLTTLSV
jgi:hypothetical protein